MIETNGLSNARPQQLHKFHIISVQQKLEVIFVYRCRFFYNNIAGAYNYIYFDNAIRRLVKS